MNDFSQHMPQKINNGIASVKLSISEPKLLHKNIPTVQSSHFEAVFPKHCGPYSLQKI